MNRSTLPTNEALFSDLDVWFYMYNFLIPGLQRPQKSTVGQCLYWKEWARGPSPPCYFFYQNEVRGPRPRDISFHGEKPVAFSKAGTPLT